MISRHSLLMAIACCAIMHASFTVRAAEPPYNPDHFGKDQLDHISKICQNVMGLNPDERLSGGKRMGNDRLGYWTSHYRGCILSLSDSLQHATDEQVTQQADADCRAKGFASGSSDLALCVIQSVNDHPDPEPIQASTAATRANPKPPTASGSFTDASPDEISHREQMACVALGLEPSHAARKSCVKDLSDTLYAVDHPIE